MSIESLSKELESEYEGETGSFLSTGSVYIVQYPTEDKNLVKEVEFSADTGKPTGKEKIVQRKYKTNQ